MSALKIFERTNSPRSWNIASFHSRHSLTWRWLLNVTFFDSWHVWPIWMPYPKIGPHSLFQWQLRIPLLCILRFNQQRPMWFRDMYMKLRDRVDQENGTLWLPDNSPDKIHRKPPRLIVIDTSDRTIQ